MPSTEHPRRVVFFGWKVVAVSFLIAVFAWGLGFYGPSVYVAELVRTRGWAVSAVSGAVTLHFLFSAALVVGLADAHAGFGVVAVTRAGIVAFGLGVLGFAHAREVWHLYVAALATGIGWATLSGAAINTFVSVWFDARRPLALSHAYNGASIGGVVFTPLWIALIGTFDFETAALLVAVGGLLVLWPLAGRVLGKRPVDIGLTVDGVTGAPARATVETARDTRPAMTQRQLLTDRRFLSLSVAYAIGIFAQMGLITHLIVRLKPDLGPEMSALALSLATACAIVGRFLLAGFIGVSRRRAAGAVNFLVQASGVALLIFGSTPWPLLAGCILFGLGIGNLLSLPPLILQAEQRPVDVGRALALLTAVNQVFYAFAPGIFGVLRDATGSYSMPFGIAIVLQLLSAAMVVAGGASGRSAAR